MIDADVARAAGRRSSQDPTSSACRDFLACMHEETRHVLSRSEELRREWVEHASSYAVRWQALMRSRGRLVDLGTCRDADLRDLVARHAATSAQRDRVLKDVHLVEAARSADRVVCSRDDHVRRDLRQLAPAVTQLARVVWVDPTCAEEEPLAWLRQGARSDPWRRLDRDAG